MKKQLENTDGPHWIMAMATARGSINHLIEREDHLIEDADKRITREQRDLAFCIENAGYSADAITSEIERSTRQINELRTYRDEHKALRDGYLVAAAIIEAASGEYHYAAHKGYYMTRLAKFEEEEERDAYLEEHEDWHEATDEEMNLVFWGQVLPTNGAAAK